jgi:hypothetical protein
VTATTEKEISPVRRAGQEICAQFERLWPYQDLQENLITKVVLREEEKVAQEIDSSTQEIIEGIVDDVNKKVRVQLQALSPDVLVLPSEAHCHLWLDDWYDFLMDFSHSYAPKGRQRSAEPLLKFLLTSCEHTFWIWRQWTLSCLWHDDYCGAFGLLDAAKQLHEFSSATRHHPYWLCSFAILKLERDEDKEGAIEYATRARDIFGASRATIDFYKALANGARGAQLTAILTLND